MCCINEAPAAPELETNALINELQKIRVQHILLLPAELCKSVCKSICHHTKWAVASLKRVTRIACRDTSEGVAQQ
jgi:hypothetical protein